MRVKENYYYKFEKQIIEFCKTVEDERYLILKLIYLSKEFKAYQKEQERLKKQIRFYVNNDELQIKVG